VVEAMGCDTRRVDIFMPLRRRRAKARVKTQFDARTRQRGEKISASGWWRFAGTVERLQTESETLRQRTEGMQMRATQLASCQRRA
jgi:hypothetical protein